MYPCLKGKSGFLTLLALIFTLVVVFAIFYITINTYFKRISSETKATISPSENAIEPFGYRDIEGNTRNKIDESTSQYMDYLEGMQKKLE